MVLSPILGVSGYSGKGRERLESELERVLKGGIVLLVKVGGLVDPTTTSLILVKNTNCEPQHHALVIVVPIEYYIVQDLSIYGSTTNWTISIIDQS